MFLSAFLSKHQNKEVQFDTDSFPIIIDTGASSGFTFCKKDFLFLSKYQGSVKGLGRLAIQGKGTVTYKIKNEIHYVYSISSG